MNQTKTKTKSIVTFTPNRLMWVTEAKQIARVTGVSLRTGKTFTAVVHSKYANLLNLIIDKIAEQTPITCELVQQLRTVNGKSHVNLFINPVKPKQEPKSNSLTVTKADLSK